MTNRSVRHTNLTFANTNEPYQKQQSTQMLKRNVTNNGFRPHGGYRGLHSHPPSPYSFNKPDEFHEQIQHDVNEWLESETKEYAPGYALSTSKLSTHSGESPLFLNGFLAPSRLEEKQTTANHYAAKSQRRGKKGQLYYRPDGKHDYLSATSRPQSASSLSLESVKYGRPTRTTLLRERHRCNSAPLSTSAARKELQKKFEDSMKYRSAATPTITELLSPKVRNGESMYSFLIGARYNRAHCLDARSAENFGVYMPRNNPLACFIVKDKYSRSGSDGVPDTPPDSPMSQSDNEEEELSESQSTTHKQAWSSETNKQEYSRPHSAAKPPRVPIIQQIINLDDGLNVTGRGVKDKTTRLSERPRTARVSSARQSRSRPNSAVHTSASTPRTDPPFVLVHGKAMTSRQSSRDAIDKTMKANQPKLTIPTAKPVEEAPPLQQPPPTQRSPLSSNESTLKEPRRASRPKSSRQRTSVHSQPVHSEPAGEQYIDSITAESTDKVTDVSAGSKSNHVTDDVMPAQGVPDRSETEQSAQVDNVNNDFSRSDVISDVGDSESTRHVRFADELRVEHAMNNLSLFDDVTQQIQNEKYSGETEQKETGDGECEGGTGETGHMGGVGDGGHKHVSTTEDVTFFLTEEEKQEAQQADESAST